MIKINTKLYITLFTTVFSLKFEEDGECFVELATVKRLESGHFKC